MRCIDCRSDKDIESAHYLPQKRFPMSALWRINLYYGCSKCNGKLGAKIKWSIQAVKLLSIYAMIKLLKYSAAVLIIIILISYIYYDVTLNGSTITNQIQDDFIELQGQLLSVDGSQPSNCSLVAPLA